MINLDHLRDIESTVAGGVEPLFGEEPGVCAVLVGVRNDKEGIRVRVSVSSRRLDCKAAHAEVLVREEAMTSTMLDEHMKQVGRGMARTFVKMVASHIKGG